MTSESASATSNSREAEASDYVEPETEGLSIETHPAIRPTIISLAILILIVLGIIGYLVANPDVFDDRQITNIAINIVGLLGVIGIIRLLVRIFIYLRTNYHITDDGVYREYQLLMRTKRQGVPYERIRSHQMRQSRLQYFLGYGDIVLNEGLGTLKLPDIPDPQILHKRIREKVENNR